MKELLLTTLLIISSLIALFSVLASSPRKAILGWLSLGVLQSVFLLILGFELVSLLNGFFIIASATALKLFSSLYGSKEIDQLEKKISIRNWIFGIGQALTLTAVMGFAFSELAPREGIRPDIENGFFASQINLKFPELFWIMGFVLFVFIILIATIGRPSWTKTDEGGK